MRCAVYVCADTDETLTNVSELSTGHKSKNKSNTAAQGNEPVTSR